MATTSWDRSDATYPILTIETSDRTAFRRGLSEWWAELLKRAGDAKDWNAVVADIWVDTGRVIGHVQRSAEDVGMDAGFRVCVSSPSIAKRVAGSDEAEDGWVEEEARLRLEDDVQVAIGLEPAAPVLRQLADKHAFTVFVTSWGTGPLDDALDIFTAEGP